MCLESKAKQGLIHHHRTNHHSQIILSSLLLVAFGIIIIATDRGWWLHGDLAAEDHVFVRRHRGVVRSRRVSIALINLSRSRHLADERPWKAQGVMSN